MMAGAKWQGEVLDSHNGLGYCVRYRLDGGLMHMEVNRQRIPAAKPLPGKSDEENARYFLKEYIKKIRLTAA